MKRLNNKGNVLLQTIVVLTVITGGFYFLVSQINNQKNIVLETDSVMNVRFALHSLLDYTIFGMRQKYCFSDTLLSEPCALTHPASSERLLMSASQANILNAQLSADPVTAPLAGNLRLKSFQRITPLDRLSAGHPLFPLVQRIGRKIKDARFKIEARVEESELVPKAGQEIFLLVTASLVDSANKDLVTNNQKLSVTSYLTAFPREMGTFGLVIANDLHLDGPFDRNWGKGNVGIHMFDPEAGSTFPPSGQGLTFLSPVFVNGDVYLPKGSNKAYTPVTFAERLYLGNGEVKDGGAPFTPASPGGVGSRFWSDIPSFGGFQAGINNDGAKDRGLLVFAGLSPSAPADAALMQKCVLRNMVKTDVSIIRKSSFYGNLISTAPDGVTYRLGLSEGNSFLPQTNHLQPVDSSKWATGTFERGPDGDGPTTMVQVRVGDRSFKAQLLPDGFLNLFPEPGSMAYKAKLQADLNAAKAISPADQAAVDAAQAKYDAFIDILTNKRPSLKLRMLPVALAGEGPQPHLTDLQIEVANPGSFLDSNGNLSPPKIEILAYDGTYSNSQPIGIPNNKLISKLEFGWDAGLNKFTFPGSLSDESNKIRNIPTDTTDYFTLDKKCQELRGASVSQAFGGAPWDTDFSGQTRERSWNFAANSPSDPYNDPLLPEFELNGKWATSGPSSFRVRSIVGNCRIPGDAELVTGFYTCDKLVIEQRVAGAKPLRIIGTFIVGSLEIHPSALIAGIRWSSIYHPQATLDLRKAKVLASKSGADCSSPPTDGAGKVLPVWHPEPSIRDAQDRFSCNAISLREKAANFRWTAMDPDCGINGPLASNTTCKNRILHFLIMEHARGGGL